MEEYEIEASEVALSGRIVCGSTEGYDSTGGKDSLEQTLGFLDEINRDMCDRSLSPIPCIVSQGVLIGRATSGQYREDVYTLDFSWSPRSKPMDKNVFLDTLVQYAVGLGQKMKQTRMYLEFEGKTTVLKRKED